LTDLLIEHGYDVVVAADGAEGLNVAEKERPRLALVDTRLPKMGGYEVCRRIKGIKGLDAKVIMFTAYGDAVNTVKAKEVGADYFLAKTEDFTNIHQAMKELLEGRRR
jgi:DNA-binding response OmpR family regulator